MSRPQIGNRRYSNKLALLQRINFSPSGIGQTIRQLIGRDYLKILGLFVLFRLLITLIGAYTASITTPTSAFVGQTIYETFRITAPSSGRLAELFLLPWLRWDTGWYLKIAALGYSATDGTIIFPPLYPLLIRWFALLFHGDYLLSGLFVSNVFSGICFILFYKLTMVEMRSEALAWRSLIYLVAYPAALFFAAAYSESTFLIFALAAWIAVLEKRWIWGGILAGIASLARLQGWLLAFPFLWLLVSNRDISIAESPLGEVKRVFRQYTSKQAWKEFSSRLLAGGWGVIFFPLLAYTGYSLWLSVQGLGSISEAFRKYWDLTVVPPWVGFLEFVQRVLSGNLLFVDWVDLILFLIVIFVSILAVFRVRIEYSIYIWITLALMFMRGFSTHLFPGFMRYSMTLFPIFWIIPKLIKNKYLEMALLTLSLLVQYILLWMFLNWYWVA